MKKKVTCGFILVKKASDQYKMLVVHPTNIFSVNQHYDFPKGLFDGEIDGNYLDAAIRELKEETGIDLLKYEMILKDIVDLGLMPYNQEKDINLFLLFDKDNLIQELISNKDNQLKLTCQSMVEVKRNNEIHYIPEVDEFLMAELNCYFNCYFDCNGDCDFNHDCQGGNDHHSQIQFKDIRLSKSMNKVMQKLQPIIVKRLA